MIAGLLNIRGQLPPTMSSSNAVRLDGSASVGSGALPIDVLTHLPIQFSWASWHCQTNTTTYCPDVTVGIVGKVVRWVVGSLDQFQPEDAEYR